MIDLMKKKAKEQQRANQEVDLDTNTSELLHGVNVQTKVMRQVLDRLIPKDDEHLVIKEMENHNIEVVPHTLMTYRVPVHQKWSPAKFRVMFTDVSEKEKANLDLRIFVSQ